MIEFISLYTIMTISTTIACFNNRGKKLVSNMADSFIVGLLWPISITTWILIIIFNKSRE